MAFELPRPGTRNDWLASVVVAAAIVAAVLFRLSAAEAMSADPLQGAAYLDTGAYDDDASAMLAAGDPFQPPVSYRPPGYPWLIATVRALGGSEQSMPTLQAWIGGLSTLLLALLAWSLVRSRRLTGVAAWLFALHPLLGYFAAERLETTWMVFWVLLHLTTLSSALQVGSSGRWAAAGATLAGAALVRPNVLLWLPFLAIGAMRRNGKAAGFAAGLTCVLLIAPVTLKNLMSGGQVVLVSANGGVNLWLGNVPDPEIQGRVPYYAMLPGPVAGWLWDQLNARAVDDGAETLAEQSGWFAGEALGEMVGHPLRTVKLLASKSLAFVNRIDLSNNRDLYRAGSPLRPFHAWLRSWAVLVPFALVGIWATWASKDPRWRWLFAFSMVFALSVVLFFVSGRHRAPVVPAVILLALPGFRAGLDVFRKRTWDSRVVVLVLVGSFVSTHDWFGHKKLYENYEIDPVGVANAWIEAGDPPEAENALRRALERIPEDSLAAGNLGFLALMQGRYAEAEATLRQAVANGGGARPMRNLAQALLFQGRAEEALPFARQATEDEPGNGHGWAVTGRVLAALRRYADARAALTHALLLLGDDPATIPMKDFLAGLPEGQ